MRQSKQPSLPDFGANVIASRRFVKSWFRLPVAIKEAAEKTIKLLRENAFHTSLRTHKVKSLKGIFECYVTFSYRLLFCFEQPDIHLLDVGPHACIDRIRLRQLGDSQQKMRKRYH
jgi:mRNA-degrading endonuclease YafQ of YafQ-DinJ toxin-antitoxin module